MTVKIQQGQRVVMPRNPVTNQLLQNSPQTLVRGEDPAVNYWQVNLAPQYRQGIGPTTDGMPAHAFPAQPTGQIQWRLRWGGGGINFQSQEMFYPVAGASFVVSGDNVMVEVFTFDNTVFSDFDVPVVSGWLKPLGAPTAPQPLMGSLFQAALYGPQFVKPWTKAVHVGSSLPGATITVRLYFSAVAFNEYQYTSGIVEPVARIPIPSNVYMVEAFADIGDVNVVEEYAFT